MRSRWVDSLKRGISASPRLDERSPQPSRASSTPTSVSTLSSASAPSLRGVENPAYIHNADRCDCVGPCSVLRVLENCVLQGGVHHTHLHVLTYLGRPLRSNCCCYPVAVQWFRAVGDEDDFQVIPGACDEWYTPTADDIGARILAKVMIEDHDGLKTKMLEYGPIQADPEVRNKVDMYLERRSVLFMGIQSLSMQDGSEYLNEEELRESWTLLIDDRRVRLTCESSLIPPFASLYTADIQLEMVCQTSNEFYLHLAAGCFVRLRAESNIMRDIIVLTIRAFTNLAVVAVDSNPSDSVSPRSRQSCAKAHHTQVLSTPSPPCVDLLPWHRKTTELSRHDFPDSTATSTIVDDLDDSMGSESRRLSVTSSVGNDAMCQSEGLEDSLLLDAEMLLEKAQKMGLPSQKSVKRISLFDIPDLQILEISDELNDPIGTEGTHLRDGEETLPQWLRRRRHSTDDADDSDKEDHEQGNNVDGSGVAEEREEASGLDRAIEDFIASGKQDPVDVSALRKRYVAIFCSLQRELHTYKQRVDTFATQLQEEQELNASFRKDIEALRSALTSQQLADKVYDLVSTDLQQLMTRSVDEKPRL
ncbi:hypothetical protein CCR75_007694 [Bremia lactucae]|uniref:Uncharacterized protein n=1 Tax=Bremia lactucae TaxID=4779 RepID=A0A976FKY3_BRELC|nr:hypothetical protein CCR75_007694 [Bremia lactucae]